MRAPVVFKLSRGQRMPSLRTMKRRIASCSGLQAVPHILNLALSDYVSFKQPLALRHLHNALARAGPEWYVCVCECGGELQ